MQAQMKQFTDSGKDVSMHVHDERCMFAFQGPQAVSVLQPLMQDGVDLGELYFGMMIKVDVAGVPCFVTRTGYTGEDGFEISVPNEGALHLLTELVDKQGPEVVRLAGLFSRRH